VRTDRDRVRRNAVPGGSFVLIYATSPSAGRRSRGPRRARRRRGGAGAADGNSRHSEVIASCPTDVEPVARGSRQAAVRFCGTTDAMILLRRRRRVMSAFTRDP